MRISSNRLGFLLSAVLAIGLSLLIAGHANAARGTTVLKAQGHITILSHSLVAKNGVKPASTATNGGTTFGIITSPTDGTPYTFSVNFTDDNAAPSLTANITWGDATSSVGTITGTAPNFTVSASHTWANEGPEVVSLTITDSSTTPPTVSGPTNTTYTVSEGDLVVTNPAITPLEGVLTTAPVLTFSDGAGEVGDTFTATVDWGDATTEAATVTGTPASYTVAVNPSAHRYADEGTFTAKVTVTETGVPQTPLFVSNVAVTVGEGDVLTTVPIAFAATEGTLVPAATVIATFNDTNAFNVAGDFTSTITWGDGSSETGVVHVAGGVITVTSSAGHTYADEGPVTVSVTLTDDAPGTATATDTGTITVAEGDVLAPTTTTIANAVEGTPFTGTVATFSDTDTANTAADFSAVITWADATSSAGVVTGGSGTFTVTGTHTYADELAAAAVTVVITDDLPGTATATSIANQTVTEGDVLGGTGAVVTGTEGTAFTGTVATFTDSLTTNVAGDFTALINWGDATSSAGIVSGGGGTFTVTGTHTYAEDCSATAATQCPVTVTLTDDAPGTATFTTAPVQANIGEAAGGITGVVPGGSVVEGTAVSGVIATFSDPGSTDPASAFTASINWGDGTTTTGTVGGGAGTYTVTGTHTYADEGSFTAAVTLTETGITNGSVTSSGTYTVTEGDVLTSGTLTPTPAQEGSSSSVSATFTDSGFTGNSASDFTATINWGDLTPPTTGTVTGGGGTFTVTGSHSYTEFGSYSVSVVLTDDAPGTATATDSGSIVVPEAPLSAGPPVSFVAGVNVPFSGVVANFVDADPNGIVGDYTATINWGDLSPPSAGTIASTGPSLGGPTFSVSGSHTYTATCTCTVTVTIFETDNPGPTTIVIGTTTGQVVVPATTMSLISSSNPGYEGKKITFSAVVSAVPPGQLLGQPTGTVTFSVDAVVVGTAPLSNGHANLTILVPRGVHTVSATYPGNGVFLGSSASVHETVFGITANGVGTITGVHGTQLSAVAVATFTDDKPGTPPAYYSASISWGDATTSTGSISLSGGVFTVHGTHTYAAAGNFTITVTITAADGRVVTATSTAHIT